jgi:excinuclease UvrABC nuclease subunit
MLKSAAPAYFVKLNLNDPFPRIQLTQKLGIRTGVMYLGPFIGRRNLDHSVRILARLMGLRTCSGKLTPDPDFSPCIYGQMGHCTAPCNASISEDNYNDSVRQAISFMRGRAGAVMGELARARDRAAELMRFEEAHRHQRELRALSAFTDRATRLSRSIIENNLVIVIKPAPSTEVSSQADASGGMITAAPRHALAGGADALEAASASTAPPTRIVYVILSGRLALQRSFTNLDPESAEADAEAISAFIAEHFERYRLRPAVRPELEAMTIVARWLRERDPADGELIYLDGPQANAAALARALA